MMSFKPEELQPRTNLQKPQDITPSHTRRAALKKIAAGAGIAAGASALPGKWVKPLVDKVLVPAHAQTSTGPPRRNLPCEVECENFNVYMGWSVGTGSGRDDAFVRLEIITPNSTRITPSNREGRCIEIYNHATGTNRSGRGYARPIDYPPLISKGRYRIFTRVVSRPHPSRNLRLHTHGDGCNNDAPVGFWRTTFNRLGQRYWGFISVHTDGTSRVHLH